jgi:hypothetical protein
MAHGLAVKSGVAALACMGWFLVGSIDSASARTTAQPVADTPAPAPLAAFSPLIGDWDTGPQGAPAAFVQSFSWGPSKGSVWFRTVLLARSGEGRLHFEGPILWNAATGKFDYLFVVEPGSLSQEQGEISVNAGGEFLREVTLTNADGTVGYFRQTFRPLGDGRFETSLLRRTEAGWIPNFPGSDHLIMIRREG